MDEASRQEGIHVDQPDLSAIIKLSGEELFGFIRSRISTNEDAEDILQEVWIQLSKVYNSEPIGNIHGWLYKVAKNKIIDKYRKRFGEGFLSLDYEDGEGSLFLHQKFRDVNDPETEYFRSAFWEMLFAALEDLPDVQRDVFVKNELQGKTLNEIALEQGVHLKTIISRKHYAVQYLQKAMRHLYNDLID